MEFWFLAAVVSLLAYSGHLISSDIAQRLLELTELDDASLNFNNEML